MLLATWALPTALNLFEQATVFFIEFFEGHYILRSM